MADVAVSGSSEIDVLAELNATPSGALDLDALRKLLQQPWERDVMLRVSVPTRFDHASVVDILQPDVPNAPDAEALWSWLSSNNDLELTELPTPTLNVRQSFRHELLEHERDRLQNEADVAELRDFGAKLAHYFALRDAEWDLDAVSVLVVGDPTRAWKQILRLYHMAERKADFTRCFQILQVVEERHNFVQALAVGTHQWAPDYRKFLLNAGELRRRYDAERNFAADFERTGQVLERQVMLEAWRWISRRSRKPTSAVAKKTNKAVAPSRKTREQWILNVEAQGGSGKTIFLRWLSARKCIRNNVPYARLDFDFVDSRLTNVAPWYLIAQCARILDPQLENRPLSGVVSRADDIVPYDLFSLGAKDISRALGQLGSNVARELGPSVIDEVARALDRSSAHAVVIVLDTLEDVLLNPEADLMSMLAVLKQLHDRCPKLKVILSGRFNLATRVPEFEKEYGSQTRTMKLTRLSLEESKTYLVARRGMPKGAVVNEIAVKSAGLPFALSLFADDWEANKSLTVKQVQKFEGPELYYLVERVLKRVPPQIAWLLRYGVAARRLNKAFLSDVILPELEEVRKGSKYDNPLLDTHVVAQYYDTAKLSLGEHVLSADLLWSDLERHASAFSFVSRDPAQPNCLVIHPEVLNPLRREMQKHSVVRRLHKRAMTLAESRAGALTAANEATWTAERAEGLYHALRLSESAAERSWKTASAQTEHRKALLARTIVANEILDVLAPASLPFRIEAARNRTEAFITLAMEKFVDAAPDWDNASRTLRVWSELLKPAQRATDAAFQIARVRIAAKTGVPPASGLRALENALRSAKKTTEKLDVLSALVEGNRFKPAALRHIAAARKLLAKGATGWSLSNLQKFRLSACREFWRQGDFSSALASVQELVGNLKGMSPAECMNAYLMQASLLTTCDQVSKVARVQQRAMALDAVIVQNGQIADMDAWYGRIAFRTESIRAYTFGGPLPMAALNVATLPADGAIRELCNDALVIKFEMRPAETIAMLQQARNGAGNNASLVALALTHSISTSVFLLGDLRQTRELLKEQSSLALAQSDDGQRSNEWMNATFNTSLWSKRAATKAYQQLAAYAKEVPIAAVTVMAGISAIASSKRPRVTQSNAVINALRKIQPIEARRRVFFESVFGARDSVIFPSARKKLARVLEMDGTGFVGKRVHERAAGLQVWMLNKWVAPESVAQQPALPLTDVVDISKWYCDTECSIRFADLNDAMFDAPEISAFARGIGLFAYANDEYAAGNRDHATALATASRELLGAATMPLSVWLARANLLLCHLDASNSAASDALLLTTEEMCERLDAQPELITVRALLNARKGERAGQLAPIVSIEVDPGSVAKLGARTSSIVRAVATDVERSVTRRTPEAVIAELATRFAAGVEALSGLIPSGERHAGGNARFAIVAAHPTIAALPLELAVSRAAAAVRRSKSSGNERTRIVTGWRTVDTPHESVNERWVLRVLNSLGVKADDGATTLDALARSYQHSNGLSANGQLDSDTLKHMVRSLRNGQKTRVAIVIATTAPWSVGATIMAKRMYSQDAADVTLLNEGSAPTLRALVANQYDVIHVLAPLVESGSFGGLAFSLRPGARMQQANAAPNAPPSTSGNQYLSLSEFIGAIKRSDSLLRPVVVVHNTLDEMPLEESIRQFALRNIVAMELSQSGAPVASVGISTPLFNSDQSAATVLAETLTQGEPLSHFLEKLAKIVPAYAPKHVAARMTATGEAAIVRELQANASCVYATNPEYVLV